MLTYLGVRNQISDRPLVIDWLLRKDTAAATVLIGPVATTS